MTNANLDCSVNSSPRSTRAAKLTSSAAANVYTPVEVLTLYLPAASELGATAVSIPLPSA